MMKTVILYLASAIGLMQMFQKAGYFDKKLAFVPILNEYLAFRLAGVQKEFLLYLVSSLVSWLLHFKPVTDSGCSRSRHLCVNPSNLYGL